MDFFKRLSGRRVFTELRQILEEGNPTPTIIRLNDYHLLKVIHPSIKLNKDLIALFDAVKKVLAWFDLLFLEESYMKWAVYFMALTKSCNKMISRQICSRFELSQHYIKLFCEERFNTDLTLRRLERYLPIRNSRLFREISGLKTELILYMMAATTNEKVKKMISKYFTRLRYIDTHIRGKDLKQMGFPPGPIYRDILDALLDQKLDGLIKTKKDEIDHISTHYNPPNIAEYSKESLDGNAEKNS
jgi:tRNA nucleotidyltransferase (CCA-adding enzyme)